MPTVISSYNERGNIFNIQRFCTHDGPGIRTTVFMKGCPLNCLWCANPESISTGQILMCRDVKCRTCGKCASICPVGAITIDDTHGRTIDWQTCTGCLDCVDACIFGALGISGYSTTVSDLIEESLKDQPFYRRSTGGVTVSGGEPLVQPEFVDCFLAGLKEHGVHTALDTSGYAPLKVFARVLEHTDLLLLDIKHLDTREHRLYTGVGNEKILANAMYAAERVPIWLRMPVIPGFNDTPENVERMAILALSIGAEQVSLLPYHQGGITKSDQIGREYRLSDLQPPKMDRISEIQDMLAGFGICVSIQK